MTASPLGAAGVPARMLAAALTHDQRLAVEETAVPSPGRGEVLVRVRACGICGSDLHVLHGGAARTGTVPGHEIAGEVAVLGDGVEGPAPGTPVAVEPLITCGSCHQCGRGLGHLCPKRRLLGVSAPGGIAEYVLAQSGRLFPLPQDMPWRAAALTEPVAIVHHALKRGGMAPAQRVFVVGAGSIGLLAVLLARRAGASVVGITARYPQQRAMAAQLGATCIYDPEEAVAGSDAARGGWDLVLETVGGQAQTLHQAVGLANTRGTVVLLGVHTVPSTLTTTRLFAEEVAIVGAWGYDHSGARPDFEEAVAIVAAEREALAPLVTHCYPLASAAEAFTTAAGKQSGAIKVLVTDS